MDYLQEVFRVLLYVDAAQTFPLIVFNISTVHAEVMVDYFYFKGGHLIMKNKSCL